MKAKEINFEARVINDWNYLRKIKSKDISEHLCDIAFNKNIESIKYIPNRYKMKYSKDVIKNNWLLYNYCDTQDFTLEDWVEVMPYINITFSNLNKSEQKIFEKIASDLINNFEDNTISSFLEKQFESEIIDKFYQDGYFIITKRLSTIYKRIKYKFSNFDDFYSFLDGDLTNSDIYEYNFDGIDLKKYNLDNVAINSTVLIKNGLYDDTFYNEAIKPLISQSNELVKVENTNVPMLHENDVLPYQSGVFMRRISIYYISDIHIDNKIARRFKNHATEQEIEYYVKTIVDKMIDSMPSEVVGEFILIAGDVSSSFKISKIFYQKLVERNRISSKKIICVLGNHELWNLDRASDNNVDSIVKLYKKMFDELGITFLQNELLVIGDDFEIITESEIESMTEDELKKRTLESQLTIFGGIGFSGYNPDFNASKLIYFDAVPTLEEDKKLTNKFNSLYTKLKDCLSNRKIIILTHHPKQDWSTDNYNSNWIYINGHTHKNVYEKNSDKQLYADNQVGYFNEDVRLKRIDYSLKCNIFNDYEDGIHLISLEQYLLFYRKMGCSISCKLQGEFYLLKKNDILMFVYKNDKGNLYIMNGGRQNRLNYKDIEYYFNNMDNYSIIIKEGTKSYYAYINQLSDYIKSIGGSGNVHGTIVDIDFYNHVYVNIYDGKITPYWAASMDYKIVYPSFQELLSNHCPKMLENMNSNKNELVVMKNELISSGGEFYEDTKIYRESRMMKKIQYLIDDNIIRVWNDNLLEEKEIKLLIEN
ncbi:MAG: metallophosphoesterase [Bacilli bacterium]